MHPRGRARTARRDEATMKRFARDGAAAIPATCERHKTFDEIRVFLRAAIFAASAPRKKNFFRRPDESFNGGDLVQRKFF